MWEEPTNYTIHTKNPCTFPTVLCSPSQSFHWYCEFIAFQEVLKELLAEKLPKLSQHFTKHGVDPALFTLNWFLCVFVDTVPVKTYLHIWDAFLFEGSKVILLAHGLLSSRLLATWSNRDG